MIRKGKRVGRRGEGASGEDTAVQGSYGRFQNWVMRQTCACPGGGPEDAPEVVCVDRETRTAWLHRIWREGERPEKENAMRVFARLQPVEAGCLFRKIVASPEALLWERKRAADLLREIDPYAEGGETEAGLDAGWLCVQNLLRGRAGGTGTLGPDEAGAGEMRAAFEALPLWVQGAVASEILDQDPDRAMPFLGEVLQDREALWGDVLEPLAQSPHAGAAELIRDGYLRTQDRALRKKMKKANHKRRALGFPTLALDSDDARKGVWTPPAPGRPEGLLAIADTPEEKLVWILRRNVPHGVLLFTGWLHGRLGLRQFLATDLSRSEANKFRESVLQNPELRAGEVDPAYCAHLLEEAYRRGAPEDAEEADAYRRFRMMIKDLLPSAGEAPPHPIYAVLAAGESPGGPKPTSVQGVAGILGHPRLQDWRLEDQRWEAYRGKLEEIWNSRIIVHPLQKQERTEALYRQVAADVFSVPDERQRWRRRVEDAAWALHHGGDREVARGLAGIGLALGDPERGGALEPFCVALVRRTLEAWAQQSRIEERKRPSLIVRPS